MKTQGGAGEPRAALFFAPRAPDPYAARVTPALTPNIQTPRLSIVNADAPLSALVGANRHADLSAALRAAVPASWPPEIMRDALPYFGEWHARTPGLGAWGMWLFVLRPDALGPGLPAPPTLVGAGGFKGPPSPEGDCETGYSLLPEFHRRGLATEATRALIAWALGDPRVRRVIADTLPRHEPSLGVMRKCAMRHLGAGPPEGGVVTVRWGVTREAFGAAATGWNR